MPSKTTSIFIAIIRRSEIANETAHLDEQTQFNKRRVVTLRALQNQRVQTFLCHFDRSGEWSEWVERHGLRVGITTWVEWRSGE